MADLTITSFITLDGVMQAPGGPSEDTSGGFAHGGWVVPHFDDVLGAFMGDVFTRADAFLLGRRTWQIFASHWPHIDDPADPVSTNLNALPKHVATRTLEELPWRGSAPVRDVATVVPELKKRYARELQVHGSPGLIQSLAALDLVDVYNVIVFPVLVGDGKKLFGGGAAPVGLELVKLQTTPRGVVIATYRRAGAVQTGAIGLDT
jgi:dihydrofolate reductase